MASTAENLASPSVGRTGGGPSRRKPASSAPALPDVDADDLRFFWQSLPARFGLHTNLIETVALLRATSRRDPKADREKKRVLNSAAYRRGQGLEARAAQARAAWLEGSTQAVREELGTRVPRVTDAAPAWWSPRSRDFCEAGEPGAVRVADGVDRPTMFVRKGRTGCTRKVPSVDPDAGKHDAPRTSVAHEMVDAPLPVEAWAEHANDATRRRMSACGAALRRMVDGGQAHLVDVLFWTHGDPLPPAIAAAVAKEAGRRTKEAHAAYLAARYANAKQEQEARP